MSIFQMYTPFESDGKVHSPLPASFKCRRCGGGTLQVGRLHSRWTEDEIPAFSLFLCKFKRVAVFSRENYNSGPRRRRKKECLR